MIENLQRQCGSWQTKYELQKEQCVRYEVNNLNLQATNDEQDDTINKLRKTCDQLRRKLNIGKYADAKNSGTVSLLEKNVIELQSILNTKNFEIKKLRNQNKSRGISTAEVDEAMMARLQKELKTAKKQKNKIVNQLQRNKEKLSDFEQQLQSKKELLLSKNQRIAEQQLMINEFEQNAMLDEERKQSKDEDSRLMNETLYQKNADMEQLEAKVEDLNFQLKQSVKLQYKIDKLETELLLKDDVLANIRSQYGISNVRSTNEEEIDALTAKNYSQI